MRWSLLCLAACGFDGAAATIDAPDDGGDGVASADSAVPDAATVADASLCFEGLTRVCLAALPGTDVSFSASATIDTATASCAVTTEPSGNVACVLAGRNVLIDSPATVRTVGSRPLILLGTETLTIRGRLDASAGGAGSDPSACTMGSAPGTFVSGGGGGGGTFGTRGGNGGDSEGRGAGGTSATDAESTPAVLRGGCPGGDGGRSGRGQGGRGGGAVELISPMITLSGFIDASGGGGGGGVNNDAGGGGGGSGGLIVIAGTALQLEAGALVLAQGGGGGGGAGGSGSAANGAQSFEAGAGGPPGEGFHGAGGSGGRGGTGATSGPGEMGETGLLIGGGGGGGGAGVIYMAPATSPQASVSPPAQLLP